MCSPTALTIVGMGVSAAQSIAGYAAQSAQASYNGAYNKTLRINATEDYDREVAAGQDQFVYQDIKAARSMREENQQARAAAATATNSAEEAGVGGNTLAEIARDFYDKAGQVDADILTQRDADKAQIQREVIGAGFKYRDRLNQQKPITEPSILGTALEFGGKAFGVISRTKPAWFTDLFDSGPTTPSGNQGETDSGSGGGSTFFERMNGTKDPFGP